MKNFVSQKYIRKEDQQLSSPWAINRDRREVLRENLKHRSNPLACHCKFIKNEKGRPPGYVGETPFSIPFVPIFARSWQQIFIFYNRVHVPLYTCFATARRAKANAGLTVPSAFPTFWHAIGIRAVCTAAGSWYSILRNAKVFTSLMYMGFVVYRS